MSLLDDIVNIFHPRKPTEIAHPDVLRAAVAFAPDDELSLTDECVQLIERDEGCVLTAYPDPASGGAPWTIGYGHTGPDVTPGLKITSQTAIALLEKDLDKFADGVAELLDVDAGKTTDNQFSAMVSLAFNIGLGNFGGNLYDRSISHGPCSVLRCHNAGQTEQAADAFLLWNKASGRVMPGLVRRRHEERAMYLGAQP